MKTNTIENRAVQIRLIEDPAELAQVKELERTVWAGEEPVPVELMIATIKNGGLVLGAFVEDKLVGFQYSFPGFDGQQVYLCSHSLGILEGYRSYGIGEKLKWAQREEAKKKGYDLIAWTYNPLETANANLNIRKLGGVCAQYKANYYGEMNDILNAGIPSDRFVVHWWVNSERVAAKANKQLHERTVKEDALLLNIDLNEQDLPVPKAVKAEAGKEELFVPVPAYYQKLKAENPELALEWRLKTREAFERTVNDGYEVTDFVKTAGDIHYYVVTKK
ncbi:GNAT family N-acetyltransferase [Priestia megaterium]|nr:GNAT family N-acetyltransferase [Priestia megaterium]